MSKLLYVCFVLFTLLALVGTSVAASPPAPQPPVIRGGVDWSHICLSDDNLNVFVASENVVQYECTGTSPYVWTEVCEKKTAMGYTSDKGGGIVVTCGI